MSTTPHLLDRLASLTSIRDVEILEFSLLKTLNEMFRPEQLLLLKLDAFGQRTSTLRYVSEGNALTTVSSQHPGQPEIDSALRMAQRINGTYHTQLANGHFLSAYPVLDMRMLNICLVTQSRQMATPQDARLIQGFLQVYRNFCVLLEDAQHDQLTDLLNRKTFDANMQRLIAMSEALRSGSRPQDERRNQPQPHQTPLHWLCMVDIDHFKSINDRFGHIYGDEVLVWLGQLMRETFREEDLIFRFGGEEFVVITENMALAGARTAFERFREKVAEFRFPQIPQVTVSCGAVLITPGTFAHMLLDQADQALYYAKRNGRNQVCFYEELVESGAIQPIEPASGEIDLF